MVWNGAWTLEADMAVRTTHNGPAQIAFETFGSADGIPLLLVMGLDSPMQWWPDGFCGELVARGFHVARFDGRDCGGSTRYGHRPRPQPENQLEPQPQPQTQPQTRLQSRQRVARVRARILDSALSARRAPEYTATDMIDDAIAVMNALGWNDAHIVGASLGAGIALGTAIRHPARVRTVVSMMGLPAGFHPSAAAKYVAVPGLLRMAWLGSREPATARADLRAQVETARMLASPRHRFDEQWAYATATACRAQSPGDPGTARRQLAAMRADGGLLRRARDILAPLLILHGADDPLIKPAAAAALARQVPGSRCVIYADMGHEVPSHLWTEIADDIARHADLVQPLPEPKPARARLRSVQQSPVQQSPVQLGGARVKAGRRASATTAQSSA